MQKLFECLVPDEQSWHPVVAFLGGKILPGMQVGFVGPLGAGKSFLIRALLHSWGYCGDVPSPTFVLCTGYECARCSVEHWDLYRLQGAPEEFAERPAEGVVRLIEWPEKAGESLDLDLSVHITPIDPRMPSKGRSVEVYAAAPFSSESI